MKTIILLSATLLLMLFVNAQIVNIPDANFKAALVNDTTINTNQDGEIQVSEASSYTGTIDVNSMNISDLTGIEAFTVLTALHCYSNQLSSLDVSNNTALTFLRCNNNPLNILDISNNVVLDTLVCQYNNLSTLNVSNNINLILLLCNYNQIITLDVSNNTYLEYLGCEHNQLSGLVIGNCTNLYSLFCFSNQLTTLDVSGCTALGTFLCQSNQLTTLDVSNNPNLYIFECNTNQLNTLDVKNGNNINLPMFWATNNPFLYCIEVDDSTWSAANWTDIDPQSYFSENCMVNTPNQLQTQELKLAPNPFNEKLSVLLPDNTNADNIEIALYNVLGKQIKVSTEKANNEIIINGANLHSGIYFVELTTNKQVITKRVIKQ